MGAALLIGAGIWFVAMRDRQRRLAAAAQDTSPTPPPGPGPLPPPPAPTPTPPAPTPDPDPAPVPPPDPTPTVADQVMAKIETGLLGLKALPEHKPELILVATERTPPYQISPNGFMYGFDIYEDWETRNIDGRYAGILVAATPTEVRNYTVRGLSTAQEPNAAERIRKLGDRIRSVAASFEGAIG